MPDDDGYRTPDFTETFLLPCTSKDFSPAERRMFLKTLRLLDDNEQYRSLRMY
ncbi:MAG: hypothetical protein ACRDTC_11430 [Pseudonocardiaceae bacterium]